MTERGLRTAKKFVKLISGQKLAILFAALFVLMLLAFLTREFSLLPVAANEKAIGWFDYWINRYQTLISGVLAIMAGAFALIAGNRAITYDRTKTELANEVVRRDSINAVQKVVSYTSRAIFSKHIVISLSRFFPMDCIPTGFMDVEPLEKILFDNLKSLPLNVAMKCLYLTYAMKLQNSAMQNLAMAQDQPTNPTFEENFKAKLHYLREMEGLMFACEIVSTQLLCLGMLPAADIKAHEFDWITLENIDLIRRRREVPDSEVPLVLRDLDIRIINS